MTAREEQAVTALGDKPVSLGAGKTIRRRGDQASHIYLLLEGWAAASMTLLDGGRQILKVHLPGDVLGSPSMCSDEAVDDLSTITPATISAIPLSRFGSLLSEHPRVAGYFLLSVQRERVALMDQMASIGRTSADARLAALLLDLADRLEPLGAVENDSYELLLTQEQIGDVLGLTAVHVNRMLRSFDAQKLISRNKKRLTITDRAKLAQRAGRLPRPRRSQLDWLPAST